MSSSLSEGPAAALEPAGAAAGAAARPVCPISLEAIPEGAEFDLGCGTPFDLRSVLDLVLVQGGAAAHPYTRRPLGADVLRRVHAAALAHPETRATLVERALDGEEAFATHLLRAAAGARSEMDQRSLAQLLDTAWAGIMDRAVAHGRVAAEDLNDVLSIGVMMHRSPRRLRDVLFVRLEQRYEDSTNLDELGRLRALGEILDETLRRAPAPLLGDVVERAPPMHHHAGRFAPPAAVAVAAAAAASDASFDRMVRSLDEAAAVLDRLRELDRIRDAGREAARRRRAFPPAAAPMAPLGFASGAVHAPLGFASGAVHAPLGFASGAVHAPLGAGAGAAEVDAGSAAQEVDAGSAAQEVDAGSAAEEPPFVGPLPAPFGSATTHGRPMPSAAAVFQFLVNPEATGLGPRASAIMEQSIRYALARAHDDPQGEYAGVRSAVHSALGVNLQRDREVRRAPEAGRAIAAILAAAPASSAGAAAAAPAAAAPAPAPQLIASPVPLGPPVRSADASWSLAVVNCLLATDHARLPEHAREFLRARLRHEAESVAARLGGVSSPAAREIMAAVVRDGRDAVAAGAAVSAEAVDSNAGMLRGILDEVFGGTGLRGDSGGRTGLRGDPGAGAAVEMRGLRAEGEGGHSEGGPQGSP
jgi:hypothetical protein